MSKNFLLGYGERLASPLSHVSGGGKKAYSYTVAQARSRLMPKIADTSKTLKKLPKSACPRGQTIALFTLHPSFIAKSYFPEHLIEKLGMTPVGSRFREVKPEQSVGQEKMSQNQLALQRSSSQVIFQISQKLLRR